jgi:hypothetical protein
VLLISHRGNLEGPNPERENHPDYLLGALKEGFQVEADIWRDEEKWFLGHDEPQYEIDESFLDGLGSSNSLWAHAKNIGALNKMASGERYLFWNYFWHQEDDYALTSNGYIWTYPGKRLAHKSICVLPESSKYDILDCEGICSDYITQYKKENKL